MSSMRHVTWNDYNVNIAKVSINYTVLTLCLKSWDVVCLYTMWRQLNCRPGLRSCHDIQSRSMLQNDC